jgi:hypothetical protein
MDNETLTGRQEATNVAPVPKALLNRRRVAVGLLVLVVAAGTLQWRRTGKGSTPVPENPAQPIAADASPQPVTEKNASMLRWTNARLQTKQFRVVGVSDNFRYAALAISFSQLVLVDLQSGKRVASSYATDSLDLYQQNVWVGNYGEMALPVRNAIRLMGKRGTRTVSCPGIERKSVGAAEGGRVTFVSASSSYRDADAAAKTALRLSACVVDSTRDRVVERRTSATYEYINDPKRPQVFGRITLRSFAKPVDIGFFERHTDIAATTSLRNLQAPAYWVDRQGDPADQFEPKTIRVSTTEDADGPEEGTFRDAKSGATITMPGPFESAGHDAVVLIDGQLHVFDLATQKILPAFFDIGTAAQRQRRGDNGVSDEPVKSSKRTAAIQVTEDTEDEAGATLKFADGTERRIDDAKVLAADASNDGSIQAWVTQSVQTGRNALFLRNAMTGAVTALPFSGSALSPIGPDRILLLDGGTRLLTVGADFRMSSIALDLADDKDPRLGGSSSVAVSPDGLLAASSRQSMSNSTTRLEIFRVADGARVAMVDHPESGASDGLQWSADGSRIRLGVLARVQAEFTVVSTATTESKS